MMDASRVDLSQDVLTQESSHAAVHHNGACASQHPVCSNFFTRPSCSQCRSSMPYSATSNDKPSPTRCNSTNSTVIFHIGTTPSTKSPHSIPTRTYGTGAVHTEYQLSSFNALTMQYHHDTHPDLDTHSVTSSDRCSRLVSVQRLEICQFPVSCNL